MFGDETVEINAKLNLDTTDAQRQLAGLGGGLSGGAAGLAGRAGALMGFGTRGATAEGEPTKTKEQDERSKVRTNALVTMAKSAPGGGLMVGMAKSFGQGGMMAGMATGITAVVGILTSIMKSSQVFQTMAGTIFKILGMMADLFLMPFVPMMMKFAGWMIKHMPDIQAAGQKTVEIIEKIYNFFTWGRKQEDKGGEKGGVGGFLQSTMGLLTRPSTYMMAIGALTANPLLFAAGAGARAGGMQMGGKVPGGPGEAVPTMLHGGEIVVPQDIAAEGKGFSGRVASWIERFQQKEMGPGGVMSKWYDEMFGNSILPDIWSSISGFFGNLETESSNVKNQVGGSTDGLESDGKGFWGTLKFWEYLPEIWGKVKDFLGGLAGKLLDFFTFDIPLIDLGDIAKTVGACFARAGSIITNFFVNTIPNVVTSAVNGIAKGAVGVFNIGIDLAKLIGACFARGFGYVKNFFTGILPGIAMGALGGVATAATTVYEITLDILDLIGGVFATGFGHVKTFFTETLPGIATAALGGIITAATTVFSIGMDIAGFIGACFSRGFNYVKNFFTGTLVGIATGAAGSVLKGVRTVFAAAIDIAELMGDCFSRGFGYVKNFFTTTLPGIGRGAASSVATAIRNVGGIGWDILASIGTGILAAKNAVANFIKDLASDLLSIPGKIARRGASALTFGLYGGDNQFGNTATNLYAFGNSAGGAGGGPRFAMGMPSSNRGGATSNRVVNVSINSSMSIHDIVRDVERLDSIQEASFFNTV